MDSLRPGAADGLKVRLKLLLHALDGAGLDEHGARPREPCDEALATGACVPQRVRRLCRVARASPTAQC